MIPSKWSLRLCALLLLPLASPRLGAAAPTTSATFQVDDRADAVDAAPGDGRCAARSGRCTLRAAVMEANALRAATTVQLPPGVYKLQIEGTGEDNAAVGDLDVLGDLVVRGAGPGDTFIQGAGLDRVFDVQPGARLAIEAARVRRGTVWNEDGGAIRNRGALVLADVIVSSNKVFRGRGGGLFADRDASTSVVNSTVWHSKATAEGDPANGHGGGIFNLGTLTLTNATVSNNQAVDGAGGGLFNQAVATIASSTFSANAAAPKGGGAIHNAGALTLSATILADSLSGGDCAGALLSGGYNLVEEPGGCTLDGDLTGTILGSDPRFAELLEDGPHAGSYALLSGSPAIDAGPSSECPPTDQRGTPRPQDGDGDGAPRCDIGAFERPAP